MSGLPDPAAEATLVARVVSGTRVERDSAFAELHAALRGQVFGVCVNVTGNAADAEDAVQETFVAVHDALPRFAGRSRLSTWVHRIAIRSALRVRSRRRAPGARAAGDVPPDAAAPAERDPLEQADVARLVGAAMDRLPASHRIVLSLFAVDGLAHAQIAEILGIPEGTVWSRLHTARRRLAAELQGLRSGGDAG